MATTDDVAALRRATNEPDDDTYSDEVLAALIDAHGFAGAASAVWRDKAAATADMVNVTESGSSRSLGDISANALKMAAYFDKQTQEPTVIKRSFTTPIERV